MEMSKLINESIIQSFWPKFDLLLNICQFILKKVLGNSFELHFYIKLLGKKP
jgi:hypothetical protein